MCQPHGPTQGEVEMNFHSVLFVSLSSSLMFISHFFISHPPIIFLLPLPKGCSSSDIHPATPPTWGQMANTHTHWEQGPGGRPCVVSHDRGTLLISSGTNSDYYRSYLPHMWLWTNVTMLSLTHTRTRLVLWKVGTSHRRNSFILYKLYVLFSYTYPTSKLSAHRRLCISTFPPKNSLCMI